MSPKLGKEFNILNESWSKLKRTGEKVSSKKLEGLFKLGEYGALGKGLYSLVMSGNPKTLIPLLGYKASRMLATEMLINPRLNNLMNKTIASLSSGSEVAIQKAIRDFSENLKEFPEIYNAIGNEED